MKIFFLVPLSLLCAGPAAAKTVCPLFASFGKEISRCEDNFHLSEEAMNCVESYEREITLGKKRVEKLLGRQVEALKSKQSATYDTAGASYQDAQKELQRLVSEGEAAAAAVASYLAELYFPEDADSPGVTGMSSAAYLAQEPCFAVPKKAISGSGAMIQKMISDLKKSLAAAGRQEGNAAQRSDRIQVNTKQPRVQGGTGQGSGSAQPGKRLRPSDISGTEKKPQ